MAITNNTITMGVRIIHPTAEGRHVFLLHVVWIIIMMRRR